MGGVSESRTTESGTCARKDECKGRLAISGFVNLVNRGRVEVLA
jgi:hypothetical protein